jgi:hypothetical protein
MDLLPVESLAIASFIPCLASAAAPPANLAPIDIFDTVVIFFSFLID